MSPTIEQLQHFAWSKIKRSYTHIRSSSPSEVSDSETQSSSMDKMSEDSLLEKHASSSMALSKDNPRRPLWQNGPFMLVAHLVLFTVYTLVLITSVTKAKRPDLRSQGLPHSPAVEALQFEEHTFLMEDIFKKDYLYSGKPSPELDKAWHDLIDAENIVIEPEYMRALGREDIGVAVPEGGGYLATLNVYHEIHCLKRLHQYMYPDYYFPNLTQKEMEMNRMHNEHCIDFLRQAAMCHGDIGLITFQWVDESHIPIANATTHQCANWEKIDTWTRARTVDMMKPNWLVHPIYGPAYGGKENKVLYIPNGRHEN